MSPRRLGQHFLADASWRQRIVRALALDPGDVWLEIGAGHGEMTRELARAVERVVAIEVDPPLVTALQRLAAEFPNVNVVPGNVLETDLGAIAGAERFHVYGNLPYYITSPILHHLFGWAERIGTLAMVMQLEVAARLVARPGRRDFAYLSVATQFYSWPEILFQIPPGAFRPAPKVASALVRLKMKPHDTRTPAGRGISADAEFLRFVQACFAQKRKTLLNNLRGIAPVEEAARMLQAAGIAPGARAEELGVDQFVALYQRLPRNPASA